MKDLTPEQLEQLLNWDGMHCKPPFQNALQERQHYSRYLERLLWRYLTPADWQRISEIIDDIRIPEKIRHATKVLISKHTKK